jgi:hypothetical protein
MEPEGSELCSQQPATGPYPEPDESNPPNFSTIHFNIVPRPTSIFICSLLTSCFLLQLAVVSLTSNHQARGPPLVGCPRVLIQCVCSYPTYLEAVSYIPNLTTRHDTVTKDPLNTY